MTAAPHSRRSDTTGGGQRVPSSPSRAQHVLRQLRGDVTVSDSRLTSAPEMTRPADCRSCRDQRHNKSSRPAASADRVRRREPAFERGSSGARELANTRGTADASEPPVSAVSSAIYTARLRDIFLIWKSNSRRAWRHRRQSEREAPPADIASDFARLR